MPGQPRLDIDNSDFITNFFASLQGGCREVFDATWRKLEVLGREKDAPHPVILSRRVIVLRRQLSKSLMSAEDVPGMKQLSLDFAEIDTSKKRLYEFADLVTSLEEEIVTIAQHYRDRADSENIFDELKNQWSWGGFTTQDLKRCRLMARNTALIYNWWTIFVRLAKPGKHLEAISSRPLLLHAIGETSQSQWADIYKNN